jgi:hypothetical protein
MDENELKAFLGTAIDHDAAMAMCEAAEHYGRENHLPPMRMGVALLIATVGMLSTDLTTEQLDEVYAFVRRVTEPARGPLRPTNN